MPDTGDGVGEKQDVLDTVEHAGILGAREKRLAEGLARRVQGRSAQERSQIEQLALGDQGGHVQVAGATVVDHVRRVTGDEARAKLVADTLDAFDGHRTVGMEGAVDVGGVVQIAAAVTALEEDALEFGARRDVEWVDGLRRDLEGQIRGSRFFGRGSGSSAGAAASSAGAAGAPPLVRRR